MNLKDTYLRLWLRPMAVTTGILILTSSLAGAGTQFSSPTLADLVTLERVDGVTPGGASLAAAQGASPVSLATADFDEDGIADLVVGAEIGGHGVLTVYPGNRHAIYPNSSAPVMTDAPFQEASESIAASISPEFLAAGDFDGDGHVDLIAAGLGSRVLEVYPGFGDGSFEDPRTFELGGRLTALATGEIHRRDGVADLVAAIDGEAGPALLILRDSMGALRGPPVRLALPAPAEQLILGEFGADPARDLAVVAGKSLWILNGSERGEITGLEAVPQAGSVLAVADGGGRLAVLTPSGDLAFLHRSRSDSKAAGGPAWGMTSIARIDEPVIESHPGDWRLTSCRLSTSPTRDLLVQDLRTGRVLLVMTSLPVDPPDHIVALAAPVSRTIATLSGRARISHQQSAAARDGGHPKGFSQLRVLETGMVSAAALPMRLSPDALDDLVFLPETGAAPQVLKSGPRAVFTVDSTGDDDDNAVGDGICATALGSCTLRAAISEANFAADLDTISFAIPDQSDPGCDSVSGICTIQVGAAGLSTITQPVVLDATTQPGFVGTPLIELDGSLTGVNVSGFAVWGGGTTVRGFAVNRFANNSDVVAWNLGNNIIEGNFLGTDPTGTVNLGSFNSLHVSGITGTTVGGTAPEARNLISGNTGPAFAFNNGAFDNFAEGNTFGLDVTGAVGLGNSGNDVLVMNASTGNTIGGTAVGAANTIAANQAADYPSIGVAYGSTANLIQGNRIGTDISGAELGNLGIAVTIVDSADNTVGGVVSWAGNLIAFNGSGIDLRGDTSIGNTIIGNSLHSNDFLGIDLCADEDPGTGTCLDLEDVTPNDPGDPDIGTNNLQNFPSLASVDRVAANVNGTLDSISSSNFDVDLYVSGSCDPSGNGEGETHVGSTPVTTDAGGIGSFAMSLPASPVTGAYLTATATDAGGSTSEFSACLVIPPAADLRLTKRDFADPVAPGDTMAYGLDLTNDGPDEASGVVITDVLPADSVFFTASPSCVHASGTVTCTVGDLATLGSVSYLIEVTVGDPPSGELTNTATVSGVEQDPDPVNNSASETTRVDASLIFADGFEDGTTGAWSGQVP